MPAIKKIKLDSKKSKTEICSQEKVKEAVHVLKLLNKKFIEKDLKKRPLLEDTAESPIYLQVMLKKIPPPQLIRMIRVPLPYSLITETSEVCLITGDLEKRNHKAEIEPTILHYKDLLRKQGVTKVSEVIPLRQLRTEYKTFESKRQLAAAYDVFLADKKIAGVLPKTLGKSFFKDRKFPIQIDMKRPNLKDQIDKALSQTEFSLTCRGNSYALEVARLSMEDDAVVENVKTSIEVLENKLPGQENNILSLYIKTAKSKAIPIYVSLDISDDILIKKPRKNEKFKLDELSTMDDAEVKVFRDGRVVLRKMKKGSSNSENASEDNKNMELNEPFSDELMEDDIRESTADEVFLKKKKGKKSSDLIEITHVTELENKVDLQDSIANKSSPRKKKQSKKAAELEVTESSDLIEITDVTELKNEVNLQDSIANKFSTRKKNQSKKAAELDVTESSDLIGITDATELENKADLQDSIANKSSPRKKKQSKKSAELEVTESSDLIEITDVTELKNEVDLQDSIANKSSAKKKKKSIKAAEVEKFLNEDEMENEEDNENFIANKVSKKSKKGKKSTCLDQVGAVSQVENEEIQDTFIIENSSKKKKRGEKIITDHVSENVETKIEEDIQNSLSSKDSSKKKNKKNMDSSLLEEDRESSLLLNSEQQKILENKVNEKVQKFKNKKMLKSKDNDEIQKVTKSEKRKSIFNIAVEDIIMETTPKKKAKAVARIESSLVSLENEEILHNQKTPLKSKIARKENTDLATSDSLILKGKKANVNNDVKTSSELKKLQKRGRNSIPLSTPLKAKK